MSQSWISFYLDQIPSGFIFYVGVVLSMWCALQLMTSSESQAIFTPELSKYAAWIYLAISMVISAAVITLPILMTGTVSVTAILMAMFLRRFQKNAALNITVLTDVAMERSLRSCPSMFAVRNKQFRRARQNYGLITIVNTSAYVLAISVMLGIAISLFLTILNS